MKNYDLFDLDAPKVSQECADGANDTSNIYNPLGKQREAEQQQMAVYTAYQEAIIKSGTLRSDLTKGIQEGQDPCSLLLKAIECISLITGDKVFYDINYKNIKLICGSDGVNNLSDNDDLLF